MPATFIDKDGARQELHITAQVWREAAAAGITVPQLINRKFPTAPTATTSTFEQLCESTGLVVRTNREFGFRPPTLAAILDGTSQLMAGPITQEANPASRVIFPAVVLELIESKLKVDLDSDPQSFESMIGMDTPVSSDRLIQPVINYTRSEAARSKPVAQLASPDHMMTITASDRVSSVPAVTLSLLVADKALQATTLDFVGMAVARQTAVERNARSHEYLLGFLNGDPDTASTSALPVTKAVTYDATLTANGSLSKLALIKWLLHNYYKRQISHVVTDSSNYLLVEGLLASTHTGIYVPGSLTPQFTPMNRVLSNIQVHIVDDAMGWPAYTLMGLDKKSAIHRIRNTSAAYSAVEEFVIRRATELRFDFSEVCVRLFDDAFDVLANTGT